MAHSIYTGKSATTAPKVGGTAITGWKEITIEETFAPVAEQMDITAAGDATYVQQDDPLGGKGSPSSKITVSGLFSRSEKKDAGVLTANPPDSTVTVTVQKGSGAGKDLFTMTSGRVQSFDTPHEIASLVPYTVVYSLSTSAGVWSTSAS
jgi:hypothetical protein